VQNINVPIDQTTGRKLWDVTLGGGDAILFKFNDGAPFVGVPEPGVLSILTMSMLMMARKTERRR